MKIVAVSDTHGRHEQVEVPNGDVLVHAGDFCGYGTLDEVAAFNDYLGTLPHAHKIVVAGNHDWPFERDPEQAQKLLTNASYLQDSSTVIDGVMFYGSPWTPEFFSWAFMLPRGKALADKWSQIPDNTDVLITHGPAMGILDRTPAGELAGCEDLAQAVGRRIRPQLHIFGHIHAGYGLVNRHGTAYINACCCDEQYQVGSRSAIVLDLE
jgi:Icc-related predicted phosphoesterase